MNADYKDSEMYRLNLPPYDYKLREAQGRRVIYDVLRRKWVALTPEEWVRQHFVHYLVDCKHYPAGRMANEVELQIGNKRVRCDSILYDKSLRPLMIIEYKAPEIGITRRVISQITAYNVIVRARYLAVSNGRQHLCLRMDYASGAYTFLDGMPEYAEMDIGNI